MRWLEDELGEKDLILAFVDLAFMVNRPNALRDSRPLTRNLHIIYEQGQAGKSYLVVLWTKVVGHVCLFDNSSRIRFHLRCSTVVIVFRIAYKQYSAA